MSTTQLRKDVKPLTISDVTVRFGALQALSEVSFTVAPGAVHAVIGPNGAGKSTMFNVLSGVYEVAEGEVRFGDEVLTGRRPHQIAKLGVARAFQNIALSGSQTVVQNLMLGRHRLTSSGFVSAGLRLPKARAEEKRHTARVCEIADFLELGTKLHVPVGVLSYGDQKRVEHDMGMVMGIADRVTVLDFGRRIADGTPDEVQSDPEVIRAYLGSGDDIDPAAAAAHGTDKETP